MSDASDRVMPNALSRAMDLLTDPPANPDTENGYLNLLGPSRRPACQQQRRGAATVGLRARLTALRHRAGSGAQADGRLAARPRLAQPARRRRRHRRWQRSRQRHRRAGPRRRTGRTRLGIDISEAMLARAVAAEATANVGFVRADAQRLPFRDAVADAVVSMAALQLIPDASAALREMVRVLKPGGRLALMVPTSGAHRRCGWCRCCPTCSVCASSTATRSRTVCSTRACARSRCTSAASCSGCAAAKPDRGLLGLARPDGLPRRWISCVSASWAPRPPPAPAQRRRRCPGDG